MKNILTLLFLIYTMIGATAAQELNCMVKINTPKLQTVDPKVFKTLQSDLIEFINNRKWSTDVFKASERIDCSFIITITEELSQTSFKANVTINSSRPVHNSAYNTTLFNYVDKEWEFSYAEFQPLEFNETGNQFELTTLVAFYINMILGLDYESMVADGGTPFFQKALSLVNDAQNLSSIKGWRATDGIRNRYWLIDNLTNVKYDRVRNVVYNYHRNGLDKMYDNVDTGRKTITSQIEILKKVFDDYPQAMFTQILLQSKSDELINLYSVAPMPEKQLIVDMLVKMDASNAGNYKKILK